MKARRKILKAAVKKSSSHVKILVSDTEEKDKNSKTYFIE